MHKKVKIGIVGSGFGLYGLLPAFNSIEECEVVSMCGKKSERLLKYCEQIGLNSIYTNWQEMIDNENLDAIAVAVVPKAQYEIAKYAMEKGIYVFAEKPLAATLEQAKDLNKIAKERNIITSVDFIFPEITEWKKVKEIIDQNIYGKLNYISVNWDFLSYNIKNKIPAWKTDVSEGGGAASFFASHVFYYIEYFAGRIRGIKSNLRYPEKGDFHTSDVELNASLNFESGVTGSIHVRCDNPDLNKHQVVFTCDKAIITLECENSVVKDFIIKISENGKDESVLNKDDVKRGGEDDERVVCVRNIAKRFIDACSTNQGMTPSFDSGERVQELIEEIRLQS